MIKKHSRKNIAKEKKRWLAINQFLCAAERWLSHFFSNPLWRRRKIHIQGMKGFSLFTFASSLRHRDFVNIERASMNTQKTDYWIHSARPTSDEFAINVAFISINSELRLDRFRAFHLFFIQGNIMNGKYGWVEIFENFNFASINNGIRDAPACVCVFIRWWIAHIFAFFLSISGPK